MLIITMGKIIVLKKGSRIRWMGGGKTLKILSNGKNHKLLCAKEIFLFSDVCAHSHCNSEQMRIVDRETDAYRQMFLQM